MIRTNHKNIESIWLVWGAAVARQVSWLWERWEHDYVNRMHSALLDSFLNKNIVKPLGILCATSPGYPTLPLNMVTCTPTKKACIMQLQKQRWKFKDIGNEIDLKSSVVSQNYNKLIKKGPHPDLYHYEPIPGHLKIITPHTECCAVHLITSGECRDATDVQCVLFPRLHPTIIR